MIRAGLLSLFASVVLGHFGLKSITVDGTTYPPFDSRIDNLLGPNVKRIEWSHYVAPFPGPWVPVFNASDPGMACQTNSQPPVLTAPVRAGGTVQFNWTEIVRMHYGPTLAYLAEYTPNLKPTDAKFFKVHEVAYDSAKRKWGNVIAADNGDSYKVQIPSDIKSGKYILRTEIIALHGNANRISSTPLAGAQFYIACVNVDVTNGGTAQPEGVKFPGAYTPQAVSASIYLPYEDDSPETVAKGHELNSKYVAPGPPLYKGRYDAPSGSAPVVSETGAFTGDLKVKYEVVAAKLAAASRKMINYVNTAVFPNGKMNDEGSKGFPAQVAAMSAERQKIIATPEFQELKKAVEQATSGRR